MGDALVLRECSCRCHADGDETCRVCCLGHYQAALVKAREELGAMKLIVESQDIGARKAEAEVARLRRDGCQPGEWIIPESVLCESRREIRRKALEEASAISADVMVEINGDTRNTRRERDGAHMHDTETRYRLRALAAREEVGRG